jgi:uncharacterized membrane-anchored protein YjiN (DUF445 family)
MAGETEDATRRRALTRQKVFATGLVGLMAAILAASFALPPDSFWTGLVRAAAEAGLVGGLADWFAVTALFRHPLGLPIPHTAIVLRQKDRIGAALGQFVAAHFLTAEALAPKLAQFDPAARLAAWLQQPGTAQAIADRLAASLPFMIDRMRDEDLRAFLREALYRELRTVEVAPFLGRALAAAIEGGHHFAVLDHVVVILRRLLDAQRDLVLSEVEHRSAWWVPKAVDRRIAQAVLTGLEELLDKSGQRGSEPRQRYDRAVRDLAAQLQTDPAWSARLDATRIRLLGDPAVRAWFDALWDDLNKRALADLDQPDSRLRGGIARAAESLGRALGADAAMRGRVNHRLDLMLRNVLLPQRDRIAQFIAETVQRWDARDAADRLELAVGKDLQYIRVTGTVIGALAGVGIHLVITFAPQFLALS